MDASLSCAGYRLLRRLGGQAPHEVWLARGSETGSESVVLHRFAGLENASSVETRMPDLALRFAEARHRVELLDLGGDRSGAVILVEEWCAKGSFGSAWSKLQRSNGEAVTALVPVLEFVADLSAAGWAIPQISVGDLLLDGEGKTRLAPRTAVQRETQPHAWRAAISTQRAALAELAHTLLGEAATPALEEVELERTEAEWCMALTRALLKRIAAEPIRLDDVGERLPLQPSRLGGVVPIMRAEPEPVGFARLKNALQGLARRLGNVRLPERGRLRNKLLVSAGVGVLTVTALMLWPSGNHTSAQPGPRASNAVESESAPVESANTASVDAEISTDPAVAVLELLRKRADCLLAADAECLDSVNQAGSALAAADEALLAGHSVPAEALLLATEARLNTDLGGAWLFDVGSEKPASVLMVRTEAGYRLREIFD